MPKSLSICFIYYLCLILDVGAQVPFNDLCQSARRINCSDVITGSTDNASYSGLKNGCHTERGPDLWYELKGHDQIYNIQYWGTEGTINIYEEDCSSDYTICYPTNFTVFGEFSFYAYATKTYYLRVQHFRNNHGPLNFWVNCTEDFENDICKNSIELTTDKQQMGSLENATAEPDISNCNFNTSYGKDVWYHFTGDGTAMTLHLHNNHALDKTYVNIYTGSCDNLICEDVTSRGQTPIDIPTIDGQIYYILATEYSNSTDGYVELLLESSKPLTNVQDIPTLTEWGLICLALFFMIFGAASIKQTHHKLRKISDSN